MFTWGGKQQTVQSASCFYPFRISLLLFIASVEFIIDFFISFT